MAIGQKKNNELMTFFPDLKDIQFLEKEFTYGILSSIKTDAVKEVVYIGIKNRGLSIQDDKGDLMKITQEYKVTMVNLFSINSKYSVFLNII